MCLHRFKENLLSKDEVIERDLLSINKTIEKKREKRKKNERIKFICKKLKVMEIKL